MTSQANPSRNPGNRSRLRPIVATVVVASLVLALLFFAWATIGIRSVRGALVAETERQSLALLQSLILASQYSLATGTLVEKLERETLAERVRALIEREGAQSLDVRRLSSMAAALEVDGLTVWKGDTSSSFPQEVSRVMATESAINPAEWQSYDEVIELSLTDSLSNRAWNGAGFLTDRGAVAVWRATSPGGAPASIRGIGELIQEIGRQSGVNYIILQAPDGIVFASRPLKPLLKLAADSFLVEVLESDAPATREIVFEGVAVLEAASPFLSTELPSGMFRVGLNLIAVDDAVDRLTLQFGLTALLFVLFATTVSAVIVTRRSLAALGQSYREVETLTGNVLDAIDQAVIAVNADGEITIFNPTAERWFGQSIQKVRGLSPAEILPVDFDLAGVRASREAIGEIEIACPTVLGERTLVYSTTPLVTGEARAGAVAVIRDETEARAMAMQVRRAERLSAMGQLAAGVAHEIRNPLNAIALAAQQLKLELAGAESVHMADTIWSESKRLNLIVEDFLSLARPSTQPQSAVDLNDLVASIAQMAGLEADKNQVALRVSLPEQCLVRGVADELRKALWNLLRNALAATPLGGTIGLELKSHDGMATLTIDDTGSGIAREALPRVFEPWFSTKPGGTGLGLAITHRIVQDHSGTIEVISPVPAQDKGTRVIVRLPVQNS